MGPLLFRPITAASSAISFLGADFLQSHVFHFYQLALLDYVDGDGVLGQPPSSPRQPTPDLLTGSEASGLLAHYREAMNVRRKIGQLGAIFGGRMPCSPVFVPGGCTPMLSDAAEMATVGEPKASERIQQFRSLLDEIRSFVAAAYLPDVQLLAKKFPQYGKIGRGAGNLLAYGGFDLDASGSKKLLQRGVCVGGKITSLDTSHITESVKYSCYEAGLWHCESFPWRYLAGHRQTGGVFLDQIAAIHERGV